MAASAPITSGVPLERWTHQERVRALAAKHWLGVGATDVQRTAIDEIRRQYMLTAQEYHKAARTLYDTLGIRPEKLTVRKAPFILGNRNVQLFLAYSILWEAFEHIYTAAVYTAFARSGPERAALEDARTSIARVLHPPILADADLTGITQLLNGETTNGALKRMIGRSSRELQDIYGITYDGSLTNMKAFLQGIVEVANSATPDGELTQEETQSWVVQPLDEAGQLIDPESPFSATKYRSVITWECAQIRANLNFLGKSEGSVDDAILIIRAFCLVEPVVTLLLHDSRRDAIFALERDR